MQIAINTVFHLNIHVWCSFIVFYANKHKSSFFSFLFFSSIVLIPRFRKYEILLLLHASYENLWMWIRYYKFPYIPTLSSRHEYIPVQYPTTFLWTTVQLDEKSLNSPLQLLWIAKWKIENRKLRMECNRRSQEAPSRVEHVKIIIILISL